MHVLIVKTSSLGDLIHTLPALTDAVAAIPDIRFDWVAEEAFAEVPAWHPAVERVLPIGLRRWRRGWRAAFAKRGPQEFLSRLRERPYDLVIDAQGLLPKSAWVARAARGTAVGFDRRSARDPWAALLYRHGYPVDRQAHAIRRLRSLFAQALGYPLPDPLSLPDYGLNFDAADGRDSRDLIFLHGTTWATKFWPEPYWRELTALALGAGYRVRLPWGSPDDRLRAERILSGHPGAELLPRLNLTELARTLAGAAGVVGVDSGLAHLAAAVGTPAVTLYGPTRDDLTGALGPRQCNLSADYPCAPCLQRECTAEKTTAVTPPCFSSLPPERVWAVLRGQMDIRG